MSVYVQSAVFIILWSWNTPCSRTVLQNLSSIANSVFLVCSAHVFHFQYSIANLNVSSTLLPIKCIYKFYINV